VININGLQGKRIVVTGAASGIGAATATLIAKSGAEVIALDRTRPANFSGTFVAYDQGDPASVTRAVAALEGPLHGLANIAGVAGTAGVDALARINYLGVRLLTEALAPRLAADGAIVNVASGVGMPWPRRAALHAALARTTSFEAGLAWLAAHPVDESDCYQYFKEALIVWTLDRALALRKQFGIRMNAVAPGPIDTPLLVDFRKTFGDPAVDVSIARTGRAGHAEDVAPVIAFLLSDSAAWVNGANVTVDAGNSTGRVLAAAGIE
jgi:NAD(P)-dependent dehydrogenase (short-subunit alcohol dehydrogenase family)